jgi:hypothetical protein
VIKENNGGTILLWMVWRESEALEGEGGIVVLRGFLSSTRDFSNLEDLPVQGGEKILTCQELYSQKKDVEKGRCKNWNGRKADDSVKKRGAESRGEGESEADCLVRQ